MQARCSRSSGWSPNPKVGGFLALSMLLAGALVLAPSAASAASDPGTACAATKQKAAVKKLSKKMKCHEKAMKKGEGVDPDCLQKADDGFLKAFQKAEEKGGCVTVSDADAIETMVDDTVATLYETLPRGTCPPLCADALTALSGHSGLVHLSSSMNCFFSLPLQAAAVYWEGYTIGFPGHSDSVHLSNLSCTIVQEDGTSVSIGVTAAEQDACAREAAPIVENLTGGFPCNVSP